MRGLPEEETQTNCTCSVAGEELWLLPEKGIYWPARKTLLLADLHLGKAAHFRKNGVNVPVDVLYDDLQVLEDLIVSLRAERIIVLGDLFHAKENTEWDVFGEWVLSRPARWELVKGNHDILPFESYERYNIAVHDKFLTEPPFLLTHFPLDDHTHVPPGFYVLSGHVHPAVIVKGRGHQGLRVSCFLFGERQGLLPAFGRFTGCEVLEPGRGERVFVIAGDKVLPLAKRGRNG